MSSASMNFPGRYSARVVSIWEFLSIFVLFFSFSFQQATAEQDSEWFCSTPQLTERDTSKFGGDSNSLLLFDDQGNVSVNGSYLKKNSGAMHFLQTALAEDAWRPSDGLPGSTPTNIIIAVRFLNGDPQQTAQVVATVKDWTLNSGDGPVNFQFVDSGYAHIRISFSERNYSEIGRQALLKNGYYDPTMYLKDVKLPVSETGKSVIAHEFGHALGLRHEHQHPDADILWNEEVVVRELLEAGWEKNDISKNVFEGLSTSYKCKGAPDYDISSIMVYPIPARWTQNGYSVAAPTNVNNRDRECVKSLYPG